MSLTKLLKAIEKGDLAAVKALLAKGTSASRGEEPQGPATNSSGTSSPQPTLTFGTSLASRTGRRKCFTPIPRAQRCLANHWPTGSRRRGRR
jgi:hypothetical protein